MLRRLVPLAAVTLLALPVLSQDQPTATIVVRGLRNDRGAVCGGIYSDRNVWTRVGGEVATCRAPIVHGTARCVIRAPSAGTYAFAFVHDEDGDARMDTDVFGMPQEGYGFANDARGTLGAPSFESASIVIGPSGSGTHTITARYGLGL